MITTAFQHKRFFNKGTITLIFLLFGASFIGAQDVLMQDGTFVRCAPDRFMDTGGEGGSYGNNEDFTITLCPQNPGEVVILDFVRFRTQDDSTGRDEMVIYDGDSTAASVIGTFAGAVSPGRIEATSASGCLTITFQSNGFGTTIGWEANIECGTPCQTITPSIDSTVPAFDAATNTISIIPGQTVDFNGSATFSDSGANATYFWNFGTGGTANTQNASHQFVNSGTFNVEFTVSDDNPLGCSETVNITVQVGDPIVSINNSVFAESSLDLENLLRDVLVSGGCADIELVDEQVFGAPNDLENKSYGYFTRGGTDFPFDSGIVLTTGNAFLGGNTFNTNTIQQNSGNNQPGDADLENALGIVSTNDATFIEFNFIPTADRVDFNYILASEEYDGNTECQFQDGFAFILTRPDGTTENLAVLPNGDVVNVFNINGTTCAGAPDNSDFFAGYNLGATNYNGRTEVLTASAINLIPNETYVMKLVVADQGDDLFDTAIFIEAGSFNLGGELGEDITLANGTAQCGGDSVILDTEAPDAAHTWFLNGVEIPGETNATLEVTVAGTYSVIVEFAPGCDTDDSILVEFRESPEITAAPIDLSSCSPTGIAEFNLTENTPIVFGSQDPSEFQLSYHNSQTDADTGDNPIPTADLINYNGTDGEMIFIRITDVATETCVVTASFELEVFSSVTAENVTYSLCDTAADGDDTNGITDFDLSTINNQVLGTQDPTQFTVSYHATLNDATSGNSPLPNIITNGAQSVIFARVQNNNTIDCFATSTITLVVNPLPLLSNSLDIEACSNTASNLTLDVAPGSVAAETYNIIAITMNGLMASSGTPVTGTGFLANEIADDAYTNTTGTDIDVIYTIAPVSADGCEGNPIDVTLTVQPQPILSTSLDVSVCSDEVSNIILDVETGNVPAATYNITAINDNGLTASSGEPVTGSGFLTNEIADDAYTNTTGAEVSVIYTIVPVSANGCLGNPFDVTITISSEPVLSSSLDATVCYNEASGIVLDVTTGSVPASTYNIINIENNGLVASAGAPIEANGVLANEIADDAYTNTTGSAVVVAYTVVPVSASGCEGNPVNVNLTVNSAPILDNNNVQLEQCDQFDSDTTDAISVFNLTQADQLIVNTITDEVFTYYTSLANAEAATNAIANPISFSNADATGNLVYVRVENSSTGCSTVAELELIVLTGELPPSFTIDPFEECDDTRVDDNITDGITIFDFSSVTNQILAVFPMTQNISVDYYQNAADAASESNPIPDISNHINSASPFNQTIFFRVENDDDNSCEGAGQFELRTITVNPRTDTESVDIVRCDDVTIGNLSETFDLTQNEAFIFDGEPNLSASYFLSFDDALNNVTANEITTPEAYNNTNPNETIFVRVESAVTNCFAVVDFDITVNPLPDSVPIAPLEACENATDGEFEFDLGQKRDEILNGQDPTIFEVTFHLTQQAADNLTDPLPDLFTNTVNPQEIFVAITNSTTACSNSTESFFVEVLEGAQINPDNEPLNYNICDDNIIGDEVAQFNLNLLIPEILDGQDEDDYTIQFFLNESDANAPFGSVNPLPLLYENITNPQTIFVRLSNNISTDICFDLEPVMLQVNPKPVIELNSQYVLCLSSNDDAVVPIPPVIDTGLSATDYTFEWYLDGNLLPGQTNSSLIPTQSGIYSVEAVDANGFFDITTSTNIFCRSDRVETEVIVGELPVLSPPQVTSEAFTGNNTIVAQATGSSTYEYNLDNGPWQDNGEFQNVSGGIHTVFVRDVLGCGMVSQEVSILDYPKFFTPNGDGQNDNWNITGIDSQPSAKIYIFDRYGKLLKQLSPTSPGWDGTFNGQRLPTDDYWFLLEYVEPLTGETKQQRAHFTLKR